MRATKLPPCMEIAVLYRTRQYTIKYSSLNLRVLNQAAWLFKRVATGAEEQARRPLFRSSSKGLHILSLNVNDVLRQHWN